MNPTDFRKLINLCEGRITDNPDVSYAGDDKKVTASLKSYKSQSFTKLSQRVSKIQELEAEIKQLKEEVKQASREDVADLFDAEDAIRTRVIETVSFIITLSKDPAPTVTPKYKDILDKLTNHLTPELITVLEGLKKEMVTVTQKAPSLKIEPIKEGMFSSVFAEIKKWVYRWCDSYDAQLNELKAEAASL